MALRKESASIKSKYVQSPNGRIFLNNPMLARMPNMSAIDLQGFEDPVPGTVDQLNAMIAEGKKEPKIEKPAEIETSDDTFDFSRANKKQIAKQAKERFDIDLETDGRDITEVRTEYELLLATSGGTNGDSSSGSD